MTIERDETDIAPVWNFWKRFFFRNVPTQFRIHTTLTDEAGHVTDIAFTEERKFGTSFTLSDFSVTRDGDVLDASDVYASYQAIPGRWRRPVVSGILSRSFPVPIILIFRCMPTNPSGPQDGGPVLQDGAELYIRHWLSVPFIYALFFPAVLLDAFVSLYNRAAFPLYGLRPVRRADYVVFARRHLRYLGPVQRLNCWYCSYLNGLFAYFVEVGARTERYWCPVRATRRPITPHRFYEEFAAYGDKAEWNERNHGRETIRDVCAPGRCRKGK